MSNFTARITEILTEHRFSLVNHSSIGPQDHCSCGHRPDGWFQWKAHIAPLLAQAAEEHYRPCIETPDQLDALPELSIVGVWMPGQDGFAASLWAAQKDVGWFGAGSGDELDRDEVAAHAVGTGKSVVLWSPGAGE